MESKTMLDDILQNIKSLVTNYAYALNEASSEFIYKEFFSQFQDLSLLAKKLYNLAYDLGWTSLSSCASKDIKSEITREQKIIDNL